MKLKTRVLSALLAACLLLGLMPLSAMAVTAPWTDPKTLSTKLQNGNFAGKSSAGWHTNDKGEYESSGFEIRGTSDQATYYDPSKLGTGAALSVATRGSNYYSEICCSVQYASDGLPSNMIWQDILVQPGATYEWSLYHHARRHPTSKRTRDYMAVVIGAVTTANKVEDMTSMKNVSGLQVVTSSIDGKTYTDPNFPTAPATNRPVAYTCATSLDDGWRYYEGSYVIPENAASQAGVTTTTINGISYVVYRMGFVSGNTIYGSGGGNLISGVTLAISYPVTQHLTHVTSSNTKTQIADGDTYQTTLKAADGYTLDKTIAVKIGDTTYTVNTDGTNPPKGITFDPKTGLLKIDGSLTISNIDITASATATHYTISWDTDGDGKINDSTSAQTGDLPTHADGSKPADAQYTYQFTGWSPTIHPVTGDQTYTAQFSQTERLYPIHWDTNGDGTVDDTTQVAYDKTPTHADGSKPGYTFTGWNPKIHPVTGEETYTAQFSGGGGGPSVQKYQVLYNANQGTGTMTDSKSPYTAGATVTVLTNEFTRIDYTFMGWNTKADGSGTAYVPNATFTISANTTLYAQWKKDELPFITYPHYAYAVGYSDQTVKPNREISRAEVTTVFFRLLKDAVRTQYWNKKSTYSDVNTTAWYNNAICTMSNMKVIQGYPDATFRPNGSITRAEAAAIISRFDNSDVSTDGVSFNDISNHWAQGVIKRAAALGWVKGYEDGSFRPNACITRAEFMTLVNRALMRQPQGTGDLTDDMVKWSDNADPQAWYYIAVQEATNSHEYYYKGIEVPDTHFEYETWTKTIAPRNWSALEKPTSEPGDIEKN